MRNLFLFLLLFFSVHQNLWALTNVPGGTVSGTWDLAGSPYNIQGNIMVADASTLTIEPGVTVNFQGTYRLLVIGRLMSVGTEVDSIIFTTSNVTNGWTGIQFDNTSITNDTSKIFYCKILYGQVYFNNYSKAIISNSRISNSLTTGAQCTNSNPIIKYNIISNNSGSGININGVNSSINIIGNTIIYNSESGIVYKSQINKSGYIVENIISNNTSSGGGGIYCQEGTLYIINNTISYNNATNCVLFSGIGGGIGFGILDDNQAYIANNIINNNSACSGGGIFSANESSVIVNNIISNNTAVNGGGGLVIRSISTKVINNLLSNNFASEGGGIYCNYNPKIINNTISNNESVNGGGIYFNNNSDPFLKNNIITNNIAASNGSQVFLYDDNSDPSFSYCNIQGGIAAFGLNGGFYTGTYPNNIDTDPLFVSPSAGAGTGYDGLAADWSLQSNSPCINTGTPDTTGLNLPVTDIAGNSRVTVCRVDMGAYEYQNGEPLTATISQTQQILCYGAATGAATVTPAGGVSPYSYTYLWSNGQINATATGLVAGTYSVTVTEPVFGCTVQKSITISQPTQLTFSTSQVNVLCNGNSTGSITVTASGGTGTKEYSKDNGVNYQASNIFSGLGAGTYLVVVKDANNCVTVAQNVTITEPDLLSFTYTQQNVLCNAGNSGSITVTATGGNGTLQYSKNGGVNFQSSNVFNNLVAGTYQIVVKDANNCVTSLQDVIIIEPQVLAFTYTQENILCNGAATGSITVNATGGAGNNQYSKDGGTNYQPSNVFTGLTAGNYSVKVKDINNCTTSSQSVSITQPDEIIVPICLVTVDTLSTHNVIYWEKPLTALIDSFFIYREVSLNNYSKIATIHYDSLSEYHDFEANPNTTTYKYKISVLDTCGTEYSKSNYHNTIHLQNNGNGNLFWTQYGVENSSNPVTYYRVYRDDFGTNNFQPINSNIPGGNSTYTDVNYAAYPNARYVVDVNWGISCTPFRSTVTTTRSNRWQNNIPVGLDDEFDNLIKVYPNPANEIITIEFPLNVTGFKITNILGQIVFHEDLIFNTNQMRHFSLSGLEGGLYIIDIEKKTGSIKKKIILEK